MHLSDDLNQILSRAFEGHAPNKKDCITLLKYDPVSIEASIICAAADSLSRSRFENQAMLLGQIGIETSACLGACRFCGFSEEYTSCGADHLSIDEIIRRARDFTGSEELFALFLMAMHTFDLQRLTDVVTRVRAAIQSHTRIVVNIGDFDLVQAKELKAAGVSGAYHVCRLREGQDTALDPEHRKATIRVIKEAGLDWYYCCEPVGPEHLPEELVDQLFLGIEYGCFQHAAMRRVELPTSPLSKYGQITERRLAQVVAVVVLATLNTPETTSIAVHEPNLLGLAAGANTVYAESGANPRDLAEDTSLSRGLDVKACKKMLYESGYTALMRGNDTFIQMKLG